MKKRMIIILIFSILTLLVIPFFKIDYYYEDIGTKTRRVSITSYIVLNIVDGTY